MNRDSYQGYGLNMLRDQSNGPADSSLPAFGGNQDEEGGAFHSHSVPSVIYTPSPHPLPQVVATPPLHMLPPSSSGAGHIATGTVYTQSHPPLSSTTNAPPPVPMQLPSPLPGTSQVSTAGGPFSAPMSGSASVQLTSAQDAQSQAAAFARQAQIQLLANALAAAAGLPGQPGQGFEHAQSPSATQPSPGLTTSPLQAQTTATAYNTMPGSSLASTLQYQQQNAYSQLGSFQQQASADVNQPQLSSYFAVDNYQQDPLFGFLSASGNAPVMGVHQPVQQQPVLQHLPQQPQPQWQLPQQLQPQPQPQWQLPQQNVQFNPNLQMFAGLQQQWIPQQDNSGTQNERRDSSFGQETKET